MTTFGQDASCVTAYVVDDVCGDTEPGWAARFDVQGWRRGRPISIARHEGLPLSPLASAFVAELKHHVGPTGRPS